MPGVRAEPKYLRDPTSFETLSSGLSRLSSYVSSNLPKIKTSTTYPPAYAPPQDPQLLFYQQQLLQQQVAAAAAATTGPTHTNVDSDTASSSDPPSHKKQHQQDKVEVITVASFEKVDTLSSGLISCLLLGYEHGFQLWNVTQPDNIHELVSVRKDSLGTVIQLHVLASPLVSPLEDIYAHQRPLLAIICSDTSDETSSTTTTNTHRRESSSSSSTKNYTTRLHLYSLRTHEFIPIDNLTLPQDDMVLTRVKSNGRVIALGCKNQHGAAIHLLSAYDLSPAASPLTDVYNHRDGPVFTMGSRLLAYATTLPVLNNDTSHRHHADKDVKVAAKDIAKEMVNGVKSLGEFGYHRLSNYFLPQQQQQQYQDFSATTAVATSPISSHSSSDTTKPYYVAPSSGMPLSPPPGATPSSTLSSDQKITSSTSSTPTGMVIIRDLTRLPVKGSSLLSMSTVAHFKPHMHPLAILAFNPAGNLLMSVSKQGHTFHVFSLYSPDKNLGNAGHLYNLSRGYTDAQVEDCQFSIDSTWCAVTTARGTSHMYTINPYGGKPEINGHVNGKINNLSEPQFATKRTHNVTSLGPAVRVKQRRPMPVESTGGTSDDLNTNNNLPTPTDNGLYPPSISSTSSPPPPPGIFRLDINFNSQRNQSQQQQLQQQSQWPPSVTKHRANLTTMFLSVARVPQQLQPHSTDDPSFQHEGTTQLLQNPALYSSTSSITSTTPTNPTTASLASLKSQASTLVSQVSSYLPSSTSTQRLGDWTSAKDKTSDNRMFGFDEEESSLDNEDTVTKMTNDNTGYQDLYSFHPQGILTLHRLWVTKTLVRKKVQGRTVGKWDLSVKEEDIAEWQIARSLDWPTVGIPLASPSLSASSSSSSSSAEEEEALDEEKVPKLTKKNKTKNKKKPQQQQQQIAKPSSSPPTTTTITNSQWLSHAEIMTYATANHQHPISNDAPLWLNPQFAFQVYTDDPGVRSLLSTGKVPPTQPVAVRSETPEPYSSRINRVGKTTAKSKSLENQEEEDGYMDDALAELEENLSTAMQTSFAPSSTSTASPRRGGIRLSSSATPGGYASSTGSQKARTSSLSFEDAYLISMGGAPVYRATTTDQKENDELYPPDTALIRFDSDDEGPDPMVSCSSLDGSSFDIQGLDLDDNDIMPPKRPMDVVFSPDGDNEIGGPSDSVLLGT
ncbi:hypothetical protein BC941DRAFT_432220 [Chlamydoabsidia padenii]|nr:hypothetical protein BC941DRAFT_432220 [Chlamydoabsidia padenii]